eukprot:gene9037-12183_t
MKLDKKVLIPLFKIVHPDLFAQEAVNIPRVNSLCVQTINDLWNCIESTYKEIEQSENRKNKNQLSNVYIPFRISESFRSFYDMSCYYRSSSNKIDHDKSDQKIIFADFKIHTPQLLCNKQETDYLKAKVAIKNILNQQGQFMQRIGLDNPWSNLNNNNNNNECVDSDTNDSTNNMFNIDSKVVAYMKSGVHAHIFERILINEHHINNIYAGSNIHKIMSKKQKYNYEARLNAEIDTFLKSSVRIHNLNDPVSEFEAVKRFRFFLSEYGEMVHFSNMNWKHIIIVLCGPTSEMITRKQQNSLFSVEVINKKYTVFKIPSNAKYGKIVDFLHNNLPFMRSLPFDPIF